MWKELMQESAARLILDAFKAFQHFFVELEYRVIQITESTTRQFLCQFIGRVKADVLFAKGRRQCLFKFTVEKIASVRTASAQCGKN